MTAYIAKRLLLALPVIFGVTAVVFAAVRLAPGDTARAMAGVRANEELLEAIREEHGLDRPVHEQFTDYFTGLFRGDLGTSTATRQPVADELRARLPITIGLAVGATALSMIVGIALGVLAARYQRSWVDYAVTSVALAALSIPNYVAGLVLILVFAVHLDVFPATGVDSPSSYVLPIVTIGLVGAGTITRQTRSAVLEALSQDYVRTARAKGLSGPRVVVRHALRNALLPIVTTVGLVFGGLVGGTVIVETIFGIPGVGKYMIDRVGVRDYPAVQGAVIVTALGFVLVNLFVDLLYRVVDKRVRLE